MMFYLFPGWIRTFSINPEIADLQGDFISVRSFAIFPAGLFLMMQSYFLSKGKTYPVLIASLLTASLNILLDYGLIFGNLGFPEMGVKGAALASTSSDILGMITMFTFFILDKASSSTSR